MIIRHMWSDAHSRYSTPIAKIFSAQNKLMLQLKVEAELAKVQASLGIIKPEEAQLIQSGISKVTLSRVKEIEESTHHDVMSVVKALAEVSDQAGEKVHFGATSSDIQDTVLALQLQEASSLILDALDKLSDILVLLAQKYSNLACIGRTHGQHAIPITVGFKFANFLYELHQAKQNLYTVPVNTTKFSGATGNYASLMRMDVEKMVLSNLGLHPADISTQVVTRLIHSQYMHALALCSSVIEKIAKEIRNLQRSEINEWSEQFSSKQVGSSTMPHKKNPWRSERISGLSRIIRSNVSVALENIALEHERDLTHSSVERIIIPESSNLLVFITNQLTRILENLEVNEVDITRNLNLVSDNVKSEKILMLLTPHIGRQKGHELLSQHARSSSFKDAVLSDSEILRYISKEELNQIFSMINTGLSQEKVQHILDTNQKKWCKYRDE
ncbi:MAG: adenylosuccinate lyase [Candidatus Kariarchaeaceae archaeon]